MLAIWPGFHSETHTHLHKIVFFLSPVCSFCSSWTLSLVRLAFRFTAWEYELERPRREEQRPRRRRLHEKTRPRASCGFLCVFFFAVLQRHLILSCFLPCPPICSFLSRALSLLSTLRYVHCPLPAAHALHCLSRIMYFVRQHRQPRERRIVRGITLLRRS